MNIRDYLIEKGFEFREKQRQDGLNAIMVCPFCHGGSRHEESFAIHLETGAWNCIRKNHCGLAGSFRQFQEKLGDTRFTKEPGDKYFYNRKKAREKAYKTPKVEPTQLSQKNLQYVLSRGFTEGTVKQFNLFNGAKGEICFPYHKDGRLVNVKHRTIDKKFSQEPEAESCLYNRDTVEGDPLIVVEGEFDCMALTQYGFKNVTSLPSGTNDHRWIENEWQFLEQFRTIYLCLDNDKAGQDAVEALIPRLGRWRCNNVLLPLKDANECLKAVIPKSQIDECFQNAAEFPPATLKNIGYYYEEILDMYHNEAKYKGLDTGFPGLNHYLGGWRKGETTIWSGTNNSGKSTLLNQICLNLASVRVRSCIASFEMKPARYLKWAIGQALGTNKPADDKICEAMAWLDQWVFVVDTIQEVKPHELLDVFSYAAKRYNIEHFIIDSLMKMDLKGLNRDKYDAQGEFVTKLTNFAKEYQVHCHLVAHPRKGASDNEKPDKVDVAGTGDITNLADNVLVLWRDNDEDKELYAPDAVLYVKKNREFGELGGLKLYFDKKSKQFRCENQTIDYFKKSPF